MASLTAESRPRPAPISTPSDAVLDRLTRLHPKLIDLSLERIERLLKRLGEPERALPPVVHVAGTNGKGSVIAYLQAMLEAGGWRVHSYTSPHLVRFHERVRLAGRPIDEAALAGLLEECETANGETPITFFEVTTAAAFLAFSRTPADILLLETGLGGRLDATNMVARPRLCVVTPISIDHVQYLGTTLEEIAYEKAGILKPGVPAVIAEQPEAARAVIERRARELGAPLRRAGRDWRAVPQGDGFLFEDFAGRRRFPAPRLPGAHQVENAAVAVACAQALEEYALREASLVQGLAGAVWPGRLQRLAGGPLPDLLAAAEPFGGWELWLDGGHNAAAGEALARFLSAWQERPVHLVFGMINSKSAEDFLRPLAPLASSLRAVAIPGVNASFSAEAAAGHARAAGFAAQASESVAEALRSIRAKSERPGRVLICGSLYLAGSVLTENG